MAAINFPNNPAIDEEFQSGSSVWKWNGTAWLFVTDNAEITEEWVRPTDWLEMPTVLETEEKFVGLHAIFSEGNNFVAFRFTTTSGQYQVDWGDGNTELVDSNVTAEHEYNYSTYDTGNTTLSTRGYKQTIITVTPVSGNLSTSNFQYRYTGQTVSYSSGFLDCIISMPNGILVSFAFGGSTIRHTRVERIDIKTLGGNASMSAMFQNCISLQKLSLFNTDNITNMFTAFQNCHSLKEIPFFNTANVTNMGVAFAGCNALKEIPLFNTTNVTNMSSMFNNCGSLREVPLFNTTNVTNMSSMFSNCNSLREVPLFNTTNVTNIGSMFSGCFVLKTVPLFNTQNVTAMSSMFNQCSSLQSVPLFNTQNVTNMFLMFGSCSSLQSIPLFNTTNVITMGSMFNQCYSLKSVPALSTASITTSSGTDFGGNFLFSASSVMRCEMAFARTVGLSNCQLSASALNEIFNNLVDRSATTQASITITGNYGAATCNISIATAKNWQVIN